MQLSLETVLAFTPSAAEIEKRVQLMHRQVLDLSRHISQPDFQAIHTSDLKLLFDAYDRSFFAGQFQASLNGRPLAFRLSPRMTKAGGTTTSVRTRTGEVRFEIAIAISMLFDAFRAEDRQVTVCGIVCTNRLQALQRIFEHEMIHLAENLIWNGSDCAKPRFQQIASRHFLHSAHTHNLITRRERAANTGIHVGTRVAFTFEGERLTGRVNRITKRATVLVEHSDGKPYSDRKRYKAYYVPLSWLEIVDQNR